MFACSDGFDRLPRVVLDYRTRFGIETSYRQLGECLARTTSDDPVYRLLLVGVSLLIRAWWMTERTVTLATTCRDLIIIIFTPDTATTTTGPMAQTPAATELPNTP